MLLVALLIPCFVFVACDNDTDKAKECTEGHTWKNANNPKRHTLIQSRTCTRPEIREKVCKVCGAKEQYVSAEPTGHTYDFSKQEYLNDETCTENGHIVYHCYWYSSCGHEADLIEEKPNSAKGHTFKNYVASLDDPYIGVAKCIDCDATDTKLLGIKLDMEGDRSHLSYQVMSIYTANLTGATEYKTSGSNTYLSISRPKSGFTGGANFGVSVAPNSLMVDGKYVFESVLMLGDAKTNVSITAKKSLMNQSFTYLTYDCTEKVLKGVDGAVYALDADDLANGVKIALLIDDEGQWYKIFVNDTLVSNAIKYNSDFYSGFSLTSIEITAEGTAATTFGVDDIKLYKADIPDGYENKVEINYESVSIGNSEYVSVKKPTADCEHAWTTEKTVNATCITTGYTVCKCSECGGQKIESIVGPTGHNYDNDNAVNVPPTCLESGYKVVTCTKCGAKNGTVTSPANGHKHGDDATYVDATCSSNAFKKGNCEVCGTYFEEEQLGTKLNHELGDGATVTLPTCSEDGYTSGYCKYCGKDYIDPNSYVKAFGHYCFELDESVEANCAHGGYDKYTCLSCGKSITTNETVATGHKTYYETSKSGTQVTVTYHCAKCSYSYSYVASKEGEFPEYNEMVNALDKLGTSFKDGYHCYESGLAAKNILISDGGDYTTSDNGMFKNGQWANKNDGEYGQYIVGASGADTYLNFPKDDKGIKTDTVWEFDVRFPSNDSGFTDGAVNIGFSTNGSDGQGINAMKIYPDGSVVMNSLKEGHTGNSGFLSLNYSTNKTTWDIQLAPAGTVNRDTWTRCAIVLNYTDMTYTVYVNGVAGQTIALPSDFAVKVRYIRFNFMHTGTTSAMDFCNMYCYSGVRPVYMTSPAENTDVMGTVFSKDAEDNTVPVEGIQNISDLYGSLSIDTRQNFFAELKSNKLNIKYGSDITSAGFAGDGTASNIYGDVTGYIASGYTVQTEVRPNALTGNYDVVRLVKGSASISAVYVENGVLKIYGSNYEKELSRGTSVKVDVAVKDKGFDVYIDSVLVEENVSYSTEYASASTETYTLKLFCVNDGSDAIDITVSNISVYAGDVVPSYYAGYKTGYDAPGYTDDAVKFDGTENIIDLLPFGTKTPGGYYYTDIVGNSYLSLAVAPSNTKLPGNVRYTKVDGSGNTGVEDGFNTLTVSDFLTNGVYNLKFENLYGMKIDITKGYDISEYSTAVVRFYVNDKTAGYKFSVVLYTKDGGTYTVIDKQSFATGWHVVEKDITDAEDYIVGIGVLFNADGCGVNGNSAVDGFSFSLENVSFKSDSYAIGVDSEYICNPGKIDECGASHKFGDETVVDATCEKHGYKYKVCSECGYKQLEIIEKTGHTFTETENGVQAPTCESDGYAVYECACGAHTLKVLPKTQHNFVLDGSATEADGKKQATCTEDGVDIYVCVNENCSCGNKKFGMVTKATGHAPADDAQTTVKTPVTCVSDGTNVVSKCAYCGESYEVTVKSEGHSYKDVLVPATCTKNGESYKKCEHCDKVIEYTVLEAKGHNVPAKYLHTRVETTCTNASGWKYTCLDCGEEAFIADEGATPRDHTWGEWAVVTPNTCGKDGFKDKTCAECGGHISELGTDAEKAECVIPATGAHNFAGEYTYSEDYIAGVRGERWYACADCDAIDGLESAGTDGLVFTYNNNGSYVITAYNGSATTVIIPAIFKGKPVIVGNAFAGNTAVVSIAVADGAKISDGAFKNCTALTDVKLPADMTVLPVDAFSGCTALESITLPASCTEIRTGAFYNCTALKEITVNGELTNVQMMAFKGCSALERVNYISDKLPTEAIVKEGNDELMSAVWAKI